MSNKVYDILRIVQIIVPAVGTFYFAVANIWGLPYGEQITATCAALVTFLGVCLKISSVKYARGLAEESEENNDV